MKNRDSQQWIGVEGRQNLPTCRAKLDLGSLHAGALLCPLGLGVFTPGQASFPAHWCPALPRSGWACSHRVRMKLALLLRSMQRLQNLLIKWTCGLLKPIVTKLLGDKFSLLRKILTWSYCEILFKETSQKEVSRSAERRRGPGQGDRGLAAHLSPSFSALYHQSMIKDSEYRFCIFSKSLRPCSISLIKTVRSSSCPNEKWMHYEIA